MHNSRRVYFDFKFEIWNCFSAVCVGGRRSSSQLSTASRVAVVVNLIFFDYRRCLFSFSTLAARSCLSCILGVCLFLLLLFCIAEGQIRPFNFPYCNFSVCFLFFWLRPNAVIVFDHGGRSAARSKFVCSEFFINVNKVSSSIPIAFRDGQDTISLLVAWLKMASFPNIIRRN